MAGFDPIKGLISAGVGIGGSLLGEAISAEDRQKAQDARAQALAETLGIPLAQAQEIAKSQLETYQNNPELEAAQMNALRGLQAKAAAGGLDAQDRQKLYAVQNQQRIENQRAQGAIRQNAAGRGIGGSGLELASALQAQQSNAGQAAQQGTDVAAEASRRAMEALQGAGNLGGQIRGQDFSEAAQRAAAITSANQFNAGARERAYANNANRAQMRAGAYGQSANEYDAEGNRKRNILGNTLENTGQAGQLLNDYGV